MYKACALSITGVFIILAPYMLLGSGVSLHGYIINICKYVGFFIMGYGVLSIIFDFILNIKNIFFNNNK
jgi:hypothetical protein